MQQPMSSKSSHCSFTTCTSGLSLVSLPHEIRVAIFSFLPDVSSVKALALTCSRFLYTFRSAESVVLNSVLRAQIDPELWSVAVMVLDSSCLEPWSRKGVLRCLTQPRDERKPRQCTSLEALYLSELQKHVHFFAAEFASSALATTSPNQASPMEMRRIQRALYRFELYCNLFRRRKRCGEERFSAEEQRHHFFAKICPWEIEQLACVYDYLFERLSLPFNDVAEHDILWGELGIPFANDREEPDNVWKEHYLSLGLAYLYQTVTAATYDDRYKLISPNLGSDELFLFQGLKSQDEDDDVLVAEFSIEEEDVYLKRHLAVDKDIGPFQVWRWAYADSTKAFLYFGDGKGTLREFGYVMWDIARLAQQSLFGYPWDRYLGPIVRRQEYDRLNREMRNSFRERSKVWQRGGRGWWSPGDESKVQWRRKVVEKKKNDSNRSWGKKDPWVKDMERWRNTLKG